MHISNYFRIAGTAFAEYIHHLFTANSGLGSTPLPSPGSVASPSAAPVRIGLSRKQPVKSLHPNANSK